MRKVLSLAIILIMFMVACPKGSVTVNNGSEYCQVAEMHLKELSCIPRDKPYTVKNKSFTQFCQETMSNGIDIFPKCLSEITACNHMNDCVQKDK